MSELNVQAAAVFEALWAHADADGLASVSIRQLAAETELRETAVRRALARLDEGGLIEWSGVRDGSTAIWKLQGPAAVAAARRDSLQSSASTPSTNDRPTPQAGDSDVAEVDTRIRNAERWIKTTAIHFDREEEVADELFGDRGRLRLYASDADLRARLLALWRGHRQQGVKLEREELERAEHWKTTRKRLAELEAQATPATISGEESGPADGRQEQVAAAPAPSSPERRCGHDGWVEGCPDCEREAELATSLIDEREGPALEPDPEALLWELTERRRKQNENGNGYGLGEPDF